MAVGANTMVESENSVAVGADAKIAENAAGGIAVGQNAQVNENAEGSVAIGKDSVASEANTVSVGNETTKRRIVNISDGINEDDAVSLRQMTVVENSLRDDIGRVSNRLSNLDDRVDDVGAMGAALSALVPNAKSKGNTQLSIGVGAYGDSQAIAAGLFRYIDNDVLVNAGVSATSSSEVVGRAGITFGW